MKRLFRIDRAKGLSLSTSVVAAVGGLSVDSRKEGLLFHAFGIFWGQWFGKCKY